MAFGKGKQKEKETKKPTTLAEYKAQGWEVGPLVGMSNPPVYTLTKDGKTIKFREKLKIQPPIKRPPKRKPSKEATPLKKKDGGSASKFGMLSVKAGIDNNPNPTQADRIAGATKKMKRGGAVDSPKKKKKKKKKGVLGIAIDIIRPKTISAAMGGEVNGLKQMSMKRGGLAGRLAKRGYGKARK